MLLLVGVAWMNFIKERRLEKGITRGDLQNRDYMNCNNKMMTETKPLLAILVF